MCGHTLECACGRKVRASSGIQQIMSENECSVLREPTLSLPIPAMNDELLANLCSVQDKLLALPQIDIQTEHIIHGGMYTRTIRIAPEVVLMGALVKIPTMLIVNGKTAVFTGESWIELEGYHVIPARAGRKQIFIAREETCITMIFRTDAQSVEQAEKEFTDEYEALMSRNSENDTVTITEAA